MHDSGEFAVRSPAGQLTPFLDNLFGWIDARRAAEIGRAATIWMPVFVLDLRADVLGTRRPSLVSSLVAAVWVFTVRSAFRAVPFTLGAAVPAAVGALTGLVVVSALNFWLPLLGAELALSTLALMAVSVFSLSTLWEAAWRRQFAAKRRVLVVGTSGWANDLADSAEHAAEVPFRVVGIVDDGRASLVTDGVPVLGTVADLSEIVEAQRPDLIVLTDGHRLRTGARVAARRRVQRLQGRRR